jgi:hypothetical protein
MSVTGTKTIGLVECKRVEQMQMIIIDGNGLQGILPIVLSIFSTIYELMLSDSLNRGSFLTVFHLSYGNNQPVSATT